MNLMKRVNILSLLRMKKLKKEYQKAHILAVPSQGIEGIPQVCLEAMANYLPVIATDTGGISEVFTDAALIVPKGKPQEVINAIVELHESQSLRDDFAIKGRERVEQYSWERIAHLYMALFRSLL